MRSVPSAPQVGGPAVAGTAPADTSSDGPELLAWVEAAREGDHAAFARIVEATHARTYTLALRLTGCPDDARDVTQEVYLRAYRSLDGFRGDARLSTWLHRITANCCSTHLRRSRRHRHEPLASHHDVVDLRGDLDPQLMADAAELRGRLETALEDLPPKLRAVVVLRDVYEMPHEVIAEELGISTTAAKVRLHRARNRLRAQLHPGLGEVSAREV